jgi:hypothetical protein
VLPVGAGVEVHGEPTAAADAAAGAGAVIEVGRWSHGGTPSSTSEEHYWMEQPQPSSSWCPLCAWIASSTIMTLLTNSGNVCPVLSAKHSCSLVERPIMKRTFFFSSVPTWSGAYCARWLNYLE